MPNPQTTAEMTVGNLSVTVGSPAYPKRAAAKEAEGGIFREVPQRSIPQETPLH